MSDIHDDAPRDPARGNAAPETGGVSRRGILAAAGGIGLTAALAACTSSRSPALATGSTKGKGGTYYWVSHGAPGDQVWVLANKGAMQAGTDLGVAVHTSFHNNDVASQKEAISTAIAAKANGIATSAPQPNVLDDVVAQAIAAGIPVVMMNSDDPTTKRLAYVGANLTTAGTTWAQYLVDHNLVKSGDRVWLPVEAAGASYQVLETTGIKSVFDSKSITVDVFQTGGDPAGSTAAMQNYLTAHGSSINAMIGLGDQVMSNVQKVFQALNWSPGKIPVVGWGNTIDTANAVTAGYVNAALWQYPDSQGYQPIALMKMYNEGLGIGYNITTLGLYDKANVGQYKKFLE